MPDSLLMPSLKLLTNKRNLSSIPGRPSARLVICATINQNNEPKIKKAISRTNEIENIRPVFFSNRLASGRSTTENNAANAMGITISLVRISPVMISAKIINDL